MGIHFRKYRETTATDKEATAETTTQLTTEHVVYWQGQDNHFSYGHVITNASMNVEATST